MTKVLVNEENLTNIANAIREKNGETTTYKPSEMASAIQEISGGGKLKIETQSYTPVENELIHEFTHNLGVIPDIIILYTINNTLYSKKSAGTYFVYAMRNLFPDLENEPKQVWAYKDSTFEGSMDVYGRVKGSYSDITETSPNAGTCIINATEQSFTYNGSKNKSMCIYQGISYAVVLISGVSEQ